MVFRRKMTSRESVVCERQVKTVDTFYSRRILYNKIIRVHYLVAKATHVDVIFDLNKFQPKKCNGTY